MVANIHLGDLLENKNIGERDQQIRRSFSGYTKNIDVTGFENTALIILLNLTYRRNQVDDLLDKKLAKVTLKSEEKINKCIGELQWFHTHNLKYPDIRVSKQSLVVNSPVLHSSVLSSANYKKGLGWSHNSAQVNFVKLFVSHFTWQEVSYCLADILTLPVTETKEWKAAFQALGLPVKLFINLCGRVKGALPQKVLPSTVDRYSPQVRMPYHDGYLSITPVISHAIQSQIQQAATEKQGKFTKLSFTRPAAVSEIVASQGGFVNTLYYPPYLGKTHNGLHQFRLSQTKNTKTVFNLNVLMRKQFVHALDGLIFIGSELALKQRRQQKVNSIRQIRSTLSLWLAPILEWRLEVKHSNEKLTQIGNISERIEFKLLSVGSEELATLTPEVFSVLNTMLSHIPATQKYAFHPKLMSTFKAGINWILSNFSNEELAPQINDNEEQHRYLYLKGIRVFDASALSNPYCTGIPSLTAVWGMMHRYQRQLNKALGTSIRFTSFSWFIRSYDPVVGKKLPELSLQGPNKKEAKRPGLIDSKDCDLVFDLVIHIDGYEDELKLLDNNTNMLKAHLPANFAGGVMHPPELGVKDNWCRLYSNDYTLFAELRRLPLSGCWVMPTKHKIDDLTELLSILEKKSELSPTMFGYLLLDVPRKRLGSIDKHHCYAEPAIGLVEYFSAIETRMKGKKHYFNSAFWMLDVQEGFMLMKGI